MHRARGGDGYGRQANLMLKDKVLKNKHNVIREAVNIYKCNKCQGTQAGRAMNYCKDINCKGKMSFHRRIPQHKVEEITSRRAARQCPKCMRMFYVWVEACPYCDGTPTLKGKLTKKGDPMRKLYDFQFLK